jgi:predicted nucleic acid-binding protein
MIIVLDASVILKWLIEDPLREPDTDKASALIEAIAEGELEILQPVHWLAEVAAVAARLAPDTAVRDVELIAALEFPTTDDPNVIARATSLAIEVKHHLFDTLYHAVALEHEDSILVTADDRYCAKAMRYGKIALLHDWKLHV